VTLCWEDVLIVTNNKGDNR